MSLAPQSSRPRRWRPAGLSPLAAALAPALAALLAVIVAAPATAHDQSYPIAGDDLVVRTTGDDLFSFESIGPEVLLLGHDPTVDSSALLVRGVGGNGGRTPLIPLLRASWAPDGLGGYVYTDAAGSRGGITAATLAQGEITITGFGDVFPWSPAGPQDEVWVHFRVEEEWYCARFPSASATVNQAGDFEASGAAAPGVCPEQVCGNGVAEVGETCDDGNLVDDDGCTNTCEVGECNVPVEYDSTYDAIQDIVFDGVYNCTTAPCHDATAPAGNLDLTAGTSYDAMLGLDGTGVPGSITSYDRVEPGEPAESLLYLKLLAAKQAIGEDVGSPMPVIGPALTDEHLEAVRLWIRGGAPRDLVVEGTPALLGSCLPEPDPLLIPVPDPPPAGTGVQFQQTPWPLLGLASSQGEDEICMATYYDLTQSAALLPEWAKVDCPPGFEPSRQCSHDSSPCSQDADCGQGNQCVPVKNATNPGNDCFSYHRQLLLQDPQSHHSIIQIYTGGSDTDDPSWGPWTYKFQDPGNPLHGQPCDPTAVDPALGYNPGCSGDVVSSVACIGYGPDDANNLSPTGGGGNLPQFSGSQEPYYDVEFADGVFATLPAKGIIVWNSHAFNLTQNDSTMSQYLNLEYAEEQDQIYPVRGIFDARWIFAQKTPPFGTEEICATHTVPKGTRLFNLSSHTHLRGVRWRIWGPPNEPCQPSCPPGLFFGCSDVGVPLCEGPRQDAPIYFSTQYNDPLQLDFDPPWALDDDSVEERTFLFCSLYDNGSTPESPPVKRQSTSPLPPDLFGVPATFLGGPCANNEVACLNDGPMKGQLCGLGGTPDDAFCDSSMGAGDGICDACPAEGGVTTEDEMFILLGNFFVIPEPAAGALGTAAAAALGALARRRRRRS